MLWSQASPTAASVPWRVVADVGQDRDGRDSYCHRGNRVRALEIALGKFGQRSRLISDGNSECIEFASFEVPSFLIESERLDGEPDRL